MGLRELTWVNTGLWRGVRTAKFANAMAPLAGLYVGVRGPEVAWKELAGKLREASAVHLVEYASGRMRLRTVGGLAGAEDEGQAPIAVFDGRLRLVDASAVAGAMPRRVDVRLLWRAGEVLDEADYRVFVHLTSAAGELVGQADGHPMGGLYPLWMWRTGETVEDWRSIELPALAPEGPYTIRIGIYDAQTGARLPARAPDGTRWVDDAVPAAQVR
jgi:hypothetical protein